MVGRAGVEARAAEEARARERVDLARAQLVGGLAQGGGGGGQGRARGRAEVEGAPEAEQVQVLGGALPGDGGGGAEASRAPPARRPQQPDRERDRGQSGAVAAGAQAQQFAGEAEGGGARRGGLDLSHAIRSQA